MVPANQAFTRWMTNYSLLISKLFQRVEPHCSKGAQSILILVIRAGPAMHPHSGPTPTAGKDWILCLGPWDRLGAHLGTLLLIKVIIQLNVLLLASSFVLSY